jgi:hypothetical protein
VLDAAPEIKFDLLIAAVLNDSTDAMSCFLIVAFAS